MQQNLKAAEEDGGSDSDSSSSSSSSSGSSSSSQFGIARAADKKKKPKAKAKSKGKRKEKENKESGAEAPAEESVKPSTKSDSAASSLTPAALLEKATECLKAIQEVNSWAIWSGGIKQKDVDSRMAKAITIISKLEARHGDPSLAGMGGKLNEEVNRLSEDSEIFHGLAAQQLVPENAYLTTDGPSISKKILKWNDEQILNFITDIGRKLCDNLFVSNAEDSFFYTFIRAGESDHVGNAFNLAAFIKGAGDQEGTDKRDVTTLVAQAQYNLINFFLDKFRALHGNVETMLHSIPKSFFLPEICRQGPVDKEGKERKALIIPPKPSSSMERVLGERGLQKRGYHGIGIGITITFK